MVQNSNCGYCFCLKYSSSELDFDKGKQYCKLCDISNYYKDFEEKLEKIIHKRVELTSLGNELFKDVDKCVTIDPKVKEVFMVNRYVKEDTVIMWCGTLVLVTCLNVGINLKY